MLSAADLLTAFDERPPATSLARTGIRELDELTGGLRAGSVWVLTGHVGEGKTTLLTQLAVAVATQDHHVQLVCPRESSVWMAGRSLSLLGRVPCDVNAPAAKVGAGGMARGRAALGKLPLQFFTRDSGTFVPEQDPYTLPGVVAIAVDDADLVGGMTPARAAQHAAEGRLVIVTLPRHLVLAGMAERSPLLPEWGRVSDLVVEVCSRSIGPAPDPTSTEPRPPELRPGEVDLIVHRHRTGPARTIAALFLQHLAKVSDLAQ